MQDATGRTLPPAYGPAAGLDPFDNPALYDGVRGKRVVAYLIDLVVVGLLALALAVAGGFVVLMTFGFASPLLALALAFLPIAYHTLTIGGAWNATFGMRTLGLRVVCWNGHRPGYLQALVQTVLFYASITLATFLILVVSLFNAQGRCLHDLLSGCVVINDGDDELRLSGPDSGR